jgi:hypothetical protein
MISMARNGEPDAAGNQRQVESFVFDLEHLSDAVADGPQRRHLFVTIFPLQPLVVIG